MFCTFIIFISLSLSSATAAAVTHRNSFITGHFFWAKKKLAQCLYMPITSSNIDRFSKLFTVGIRRKFVATISLKIPPHLKCAGTLSSEISVS